MTAPRGQATRRFSGRRSAGASGSASSRGHAGAGYRYTFLVGAFFGYGYALLTFDIPRTMPLETAMVTAAAREPGGCTAMATTRFTVVAEQAARGGLARFTAARVGQGVLGTLLGAMRADAPRASLSPVGLALDQTTLAGEGRSGDMAVGGESTVSTRGASLAACRDIVVSSLPLRLTITSRIGVSPGYPARPDTYQPTHACARPRSTLRCAPHPTRPSWPRRGSRRGSGWTALSCSAGTECCADWDATPIGTTSPCLDGTCSSSTRRRGAAALTVRT